MLLGHGMNSDIEIAELYEIEWPQGMQTFDTQKLYMAWQLQELDAASAAKALEAVVGGGKGASKAAADVEDGLYDDDSADEDATGWADNGLQDEGDEGTAAAAAGNGMAALSLGNGHSKSAAGSAGGASSRGGTSPGGSVSQKGKPQVQNAPRVRPWPAGPPPADPNRPASSEQQQQQQRDQAGKVDRQVSLAALLSALGIKFSKLHNAGEGCVVRAASKASLVNGQQAWCPQVLTSMSIRFTSALHLLHPVLRGMLFALSVYGLMLMLP